MERERNMGAGPETTGNEIEQLRLFDEDENDRMVQSRAISPEGVAFAGLRRRHELGHRPDRLHTSDHPGVRGDRLEVSCRREGWGQN